MDKKQMDIPWWRYTKGCINPVGPPASRRTLKELGLSVPKTRERSKLKLILAFSIATLMAVGGILAYYDYRIGDILGLIAIAGIGIFVLIIFD